MKVVFDGLVAAVFGALLGLGIFYVLLVIINPYFWVIAVSVLVVIITYLKFGSPKP